MTPEPDHEDFYNKCKTYLFNHSTKVKFNFQTKLLPTLKQHQKSNHGFDIRLFRNQINFFLLEHNINIKLNAVYFNGVVYVFGDSMVSEMVWEQITGDQDFQIEINKITETPPQKTHSKTDLNDGSQTIQKNPKLFN